MSFIQQKFPEGSLSHGKNGPEWSITCPMCLLRRGEKDRARRLSINLKTNLVHCFRCGYSAHLKKFLWDYDRTLFATSKPAVNTSLIRKRIQNLKAPVSQSLKIDVPGFKGLFYPGHNASYVTKLKEYLYNRGWTDQEIRERHVGYSLEKREFYYRIILPFFDLDGNQVFYQARTIKAEEPKYRNPPTGKDRALYNLRTAALYSTAVLVEGLFDCVQPNYVGCLSNRPTEGQIRTLVSIWRDFVVLFDKDALKEGYAAAERLSAWGCNVRIALCPEKDPCVSGLDDLDRAVQEATTYSKALFLKTKLALL